MNLKKLVTVIVAAMVLCLMTGFPTHAAATTKATTKATISTSLENSTEKLAKKAKKQAKKKAKKKNKKKYTKKDLRYMTSIIYCEAQGEGYQGQKAVGIVVMNRVRSNKFPDSVKEVIYQSGQFSPVRNGSLQRALNQYDKYEKKGKFKGAMKSCHKAAKAVLEGSTTIKVKGKKKEMKSYLFFSRYVSGAKFQLGNHQFK